MRLANVRLDHAPVAHVKSERGYVNVNELLREPAPLDVDAVIAGGAVLLERIGQALAAGSGPAPVALDEADLGPAVQRPGKIICLGRNYHDHAIEMSGAVPSFPEVFVRFQDSLAGPADDIELPAATGRFDYEGELGVIIGKPGRSISVEDAMTHVGGYVVTNDYSARDWQRAATQWTPGKNFDRTCPVGPDFVTADEVGDGVIDVLLETRVNGETRQSASTGQLIISIARTIEFLSCFTTLQTGDLILTGTPGGVGDARKEYLSEGDLVEVEIEKIGVLRNRIVGPKHSDVNPDWVPGAR
jgi:2-keto-4-pentenoate hydratase/2-oxohepta-3-ene-1,7-dioic acid hydratase in catechol pathway